ncbi:MAG: SDR family NAD(P)-dependent oxidoreductase [Novosphingobium sp.]
MPQPPVAVVTGASAGVGRATARMLVQDGWRVIGIGRDPARSAAAEAELRAVAAGASVDFVRADFTEMRQVRQAAEQVRALTPRVTVLINNAGGIRDALYWTSEGLEATFASNHLAPFLLTQELLPLLAAEAKEREPGAARVIAVSSLGHAGCPAMNWADLNLSAAFTPSAAYCQAKLANLLFTLELQRRVAPLGITAQAMHPGRVDSNFLEHADEALRRHRENSDGYVPPERPAGTLLWMATAPECGRDGGRYFHDLAEETPAPQARDSAAALRLWQESEALLARLDFPPRGQSR